MPREGDAVSKEKARIHLFFDSLVHLGSSYLMVSHTLTAGLPV